MFNPEPIQHTNLLNNEMKNPHLVETTIIAYPATGRRIQYADDSSVSIINARLKGDVPQINVDFMVQGIPLLLTTQSYLTLKFTPRTKLAPAIASVIQGHIPSTLEIDTSIWPKLNSMTIADARATFSNFGVESRNTQFLNLMANYEMPLEVRENMRRVYNDSVINSTFAAHSVPGMTVGFTSSTEVPTYTVDLINDGNVFGITGSYEVRIPLAEILPVFQIPVLPIAQTNTSNIALNLTLHSPKHMFPLGYSFRSAEGEMVVICDEQMVESITQRIFRDEASVKEIQVQLDNQLRRKSELLVQQEALTREREALRTAGAQGVTAPATPMAPVRLPDEEGDGDQAPEPQQQGVQQPEAQPQEGRSTPFSKAPKLARVGGGNQRTPASQKASRVRETPITDKAIADRITEIDGLQVENAGKLAAVDLEIQNLLEQLRAITGQSVGAVPVAPKATTTVDSENVKISWIRDGFIASKTGDKPSVKFDQNTMLGFTGVLWKMQGRGGADVIEFSNLNFLDVDVDVDCWLNLKVLSDPMLNPLVEAYIRPFITPANEFRAMFKDVFTFTQTFVIPKEHSVRFTFAPSQLFYNTTRVGLFVLEDPPLKYPAGAWENGFNGKKVFANMKSAFLSGHMFKSGGLTFSDFQIGLSSSCTPLFSEPLDESGMKLATEDCMRKYRPSNMVGKILQRGTRFSEGNAFFMFDLTHTEGAGYFIDADNMIQVQGTLTNSTKHQTKVQLVLALFYMNSFTVLLELDGAVLVQQS